MIYCLTDMSMSWTNPTNVSTNTVNLDTLNKHVHAVDMGIIGPIGSGLIVSLMTFASIAMNTGQRTHEFNQV